MEKTKQCKQSQVYNS